MITIEKNTQITLLCTFKDKDESEFFDFDVSRRGDVLKSENLYAKFLKILEQNTKQAFRVVVLLNFILKFIKEQAEVLKPL